MNTSATARVQIGTPHALRAGIWALRLTCLALMCAPSLCGQYLYESVSYSVGSDGTLYATGVTDAGSMQEHSAWVQTFIKSPAGRYGQGYQSVDSGGYAVGNASLALDQSDTGQYTITASGGGWCPVMGDLGSGFAAAYLQLGASVVCYNKPVYTGGGFCDYVLQQPCNVNCMYSTLDVYTPGAPPCPPVVFEPVVWFATGTDGSQQVIACISGVAVTTGTCTCSETP